MPSSCTIWSKLSIDDVRVDVQERLDRVLELLGVAVVRRVPDPVEHRADDLRLEREERAVQADVDDLRRRTCRIAGRLVAARVVGVAPADASS